MAKDVQNDGKVSTLSGWDAVVVCPSTAITITILAKVHDFDTHLQVRSPKLAALHQAATVIDKHSSARELGKVRGVCSLYGSWAWSQAPHMQGTHKTPVQRACSSAERVANAIRAASRRLYTDSPILPSAAPNCTWPSSIRCEIYIVVHEH